MAVEVKEGETYEAKDVRTGDGWTMMRVKAEKGPKEIAVFTDKSEAFHEGDMVKIVKIVSTRLSARKGKDDKWYDTISDNAVVEVVGRAGGLVDEEDGGDLPF